MIILSIFESAIINIAKKLGLTLVRKPYVNDTYSNNESISLTAIIANKITTITLSDSTISV